MPRSRARWFFASTLLTILLSIYTISYNGTARVDDEHILAARAQSLALWGRLEEPQVYGNARVRELSALGDPAVQVEPLLSALGAVLYRLGLTFGWGGRQTAFALNLYATAAAALLVFFSIDALRFELRTAWVSGLAFGTATMAFPYALTFYRDPLAMAMSALAILGIILLVRHHERIGWVGLLLSSAALLAGVVTKNSVLALLPAILIGTAPQLLTWMRRSNTRKRWLLIAASVIGSWLLMAIPSNGPLSRFSFDYYQQLIGFFTGSLTLDLIPALVGPWVSPAKSIFLFALPAALLLVPNRERRIPAPLLRTLLAFSVLLALGQGLFYRDAWSGGFGWGLRYMLPALPGLIVLAAPGMERLLSDGRRGRALLGAVLVIGLLTEWSAAWTPWQPIYARWAASGLDPFSPNSAWNPRLLAIPPQVQSALDPARWDTGWLRLLASGRTQALGIPLIAGVLIVISSVAILSYQRSAHTKGKSLALAVILSAASLLSPIIPTMPLLQGDPGVADDREELKQALAWVEEGLREGDVVVIDSYGTPLWSFFSNRWDQPVRWYSLPYEIPTGDPSADAIEDPSAATTDLMRDQLTAGHRIWYLSSSEAPDAQLGRELSWLRTHATLIEEEVFNGKSQVSGALIAPLN